MRHRIEWFLVFLAISSPLIGSAIPGRWEKVETLAKGTPIMVILGSGETVAGSFVGLSPAAIMIRPPEGEPVELPRTSVSRVTTADPVSDSRLNGTLIGMAIGGGLGAATGAAGGSGTEFWALPRGQVAAAVGLVGAVAGAAIGFIVDSALRHPEILYQSRPPDSRDPDGTSP